VTIAEGNRIKIGENDYVNKFGRMSLKEYEKMKQIYNNINDGFTPKKSDNEWEENIKFNKLPSPIYKPSSDKMVNIPSNGYSSIAQDEQNINKIRSSQNNKTILEEEIYKINNPLSKNEQETQATKKNFNENIFKNRKLSDLRLDNKFKYNHQENNESSPTYNYNCFGNLQNKEIIHSHKENADIVKLPSIHKRPSKPDLRQIERELGNRIENNKLKSV